MTDQLSSMTPVPILYVNHRGETSVRRIVPGPLWFGSTEWHPEPQWLMTADEPDTGKRRDFALADIKAWGDTSAYLFAASTRSKDVSNIGAAIDTSTPASIAAEEARELAVSERISAAQAVYEECLAECDPADPEYGVCAFEAMKAALFAAGARVPAPHEQVRGFTLNAPLPWTEDPVERFGQIFDANGTLVATTNCFHPCYPALAALILVAINACGGFAPEAQFRTWKREGDR